jgi:hypothetical protein
MAAPTFSVLTGLAFFIYRETDLRAALTARARDYAGFAQTMDVLRRRNDDLVNEVSKWRQKAKDARKHGSRSAARESGNALATRMRALARDILDFENEKTITRPVTILSAVPGGEQTMRRNSEDIAHYDQAAVTDFLKRFGGPVNGVARIVRPYTLDTSRLQRHIETINCIPAMRLVATDIIDLADQLEASPPKRPRPAPEIRIAPEVSSAAAIGQE